jgi:hypothetical protein
MTTFPALRTHRIVVERIFCFMHVNTPVYRPHLFAYSTNKKR